VRPAGFELFTNSRLAPACHGTIEQSKLTRFGSLPESLMAVEDLMPAVEICLGRLELVPGGLFSSADAVLLRPNLSERPFARRRFNGAVPVAVST
jgi:hypothetical protein